MTRYSLRALLILLAVGPPVLAVLWRTGLLPGALTVGIYAMALWLLSLVVRRST
jgi:hypothetical protein